MGFVQDTQGIFVRACKDQGGSRLLQQALERSSTAEVIAILEQFQTQLLGLMRVRAGAVPLNMRSSSALSC